MGNIISYFVCLTQMGIVFNSFAEIMNDKINCQNYARVVLLPLYKVSEGFAGKVVSGICSLPHLNFLYDR
jgi:hypothetical protein